MHRIFGSLLIALLFSTCQTAEKPKRQSGAGEAMAMWAMARTFPDGKFHTEAYSIAFEQLRAAAKQRTDRSPQWEALGPKNIGGRTLCLAIHPLDTNIIWVGSASGGIWKTQTAGIGPNAWEYVETGFPVLGVSALAIDPQDPNIIYAGTGEVYNYESSMPNVAVRTTRGTYGIGILKTTDGGATWSKCLDWSYDDLRGIQDIKLNPLRPQTVYAATTEGLIRSYNGGLKWSLVHNKKMAVDIDINPQDTNIVFVTHGSLDDQPFAGIYRSVNAGQNFAKLTDGLPETYSGKALVCLSPDNPDILYASVGNNFVQEGLYFSDNGGDSWAKVNATDVCKYQGWYSHDVAVRPGDPDYILWCGIDMWRSEDGGINVAKKTNWASWFFGQVPAGGPEGPSHYVHADIHAIQFVDADKVYCVTDGGIFVSYDAGNTWSGRNGGYQTQQFYANLGNSATNPDLCIGGMQDNSTAIYVGEGDWIRVLGGDGECAAISAFDDQIMYGSSQYLNMYRSNNSGSTWQNITPPDAPSETRAFNGPFELAPSDPFIIYAGAERLYRSNDAGSSWLPASTVLSQDDPILTIAVAADNPDLVWASTAPVASNKANIYRINVTTGQQILIQGLPNRLCMDIAIHPLNSDRVYAVFSGFGAKHLWRTDDAGLSWTPLDGAYLPDVPANSVLVDPLYPDHVYFANDIGVWLSRDGGDTWETFSDGAPGSFLAMHLSISADRNLRVATYGTGVWQAPMAEVLNANQPQDNRSAITVSPNPVQDHCMVNYSLPNGGRVEWTVMDNQGKQMARGTFRHDLAGKYTSRIDMAALPKGVYYLRLQTELAGKQGWTQTAKLMK